VGYALSSPVMTELAYPTVRFVGGHYDAPDLFDIECRVVRMTPTEIVLQPIHRASSRIVLASRYIGKAIGSTETADTTTICTYGFEDDSHAGMAQWSVDETGAVVVYAHDYPG
jgi:hypothetical protein